MSRTPMTDAVLRIADNFGQFHGTDEGVTAEEAREDMVRALGRLARSLEESRAELMGALEKAADTFRDYGKLHAMTGRAYLVEADAVAEEGCRDVLSRAREFDRKHGGGG